ncbi:hypothetical protein BDN70DRAFT_873617 [Pholiota conissans]|uniref:Uncharacterized protein n=1 Tax=Pholiota conissans TaxID=109636 RepID=A0A9P6D4J0_9AGAR|nr:hypothetical protein BDN70DRAFT_873617 [Pholiota conissans]
MARFLPGSIKGERGIDGAAGASRAAADPGAGLFLHDDSDGAEVRFANGSSSRRKSGGGETRADKELKVMLLFLSRLLVECGDSGIVADANVDVDARGDKDVAPERTRILDVKVVGLVGGEVVGERGPWRNEGTRMACRELLFVRLFVMVAIVSSVEGSKPGFNSGIRLRSGLAVCCSSW